MTNRERNRLYLLWTVALLVCFFMAMFAAFFSSCSKRDLSRDARPPEATGELMADSLPIPENSLPE